MQRLWLVCCRYCYKQSSQLSHWSQVMHICIRKGMPLAYWSKHYFRMNAEHPVDGKSTLVRVINGLVSSRSSTPYDITERLWFKVAVVSFVWSLVSAFGSFQLTCVFEVILRPPELINCLINTKKTFICKNIIVGTALTMNLDAISSLHERIINKIAWCISSTSHSL